MELFDTLALVPETVNCLCSESGATLRLLQRRGVRSLLRDRRGVNALLRDRRGVSALLRDRRGSVSALLYDGRGNLKKHGEQVSGQNNF